MSVVARCWTESYHTRVWGDLCRWPSGSQFGRDRLLCSATWSPLLKRSVSMEPKIIRDNHRNWLLRILPGTLCWMLITHYLRPNRDSPFGYPSEYLCQSLAEIPKNN
jgi:hypothetical protein